MGNRTSNTDEVPDVEGQECTTWEEWVKKNLQARECNRFTPERSDPLSNDPPSDPTCQCGKKESEHDPMYQNKPKPESKWQIETHTTNIPIDACGEVKFLSEKSYESKFLRVDAMTEPEKLWNLLINQWELRFPKLVISVAGGAGGFKWNAHSKRVFKEGLLQAAKSTDAWIFTGGTNCGVMKFVGEAVRENAEGSSITPLVGLGSWGFVNQKDALINKNIYNSRQQAEKTTKAANLDPNHSHFILFDDGTNGKTGIETKIWGKLVKKICEQNIDSEKAVTIPSVCVMVNGGINTLTTVYENITHGTPCLIIEGSGRVADILAYAVKHAKEMPDNNNKAMPSRYINISTMLNISKKLKKEFKSNDLEIHLDRIKECVRWPHLIDIYRIDEVSESTEGILNAITKSNTSSVDKQLRLAIKWKSTEVARSTIFEQDRDWSVDDIKEAFKYAIQEEASAFVDLFIDKDVTLKIRHLNELEEKLKKQKGNGKNKETNGESTTHQNSRTANGDRTQEPAETVNESKDTCSMEKLFLYAVERNSQKLALVFWKHLDEPIQYALKARGELQVKQRKEKDMHERVRLKQHANKYEDHAIGVLNECYDDKQRETINLLETETQILDDSTCLEMALSTQSRRFLSQSATERVFDELWMDELSGENSNFKLWLLILFPLAIPFLDIFEKDEKPSSEDTQDKCHRKAWERLRNIHKFYKAPEIKFRTTFIMHAAFLILFSYIILTNFRQEISYEECVLIAWVATMIPEKIRQSTDRKIGKLLQNKVKDYFTSNYWNILDVVAITMFFFGIGLRFCIKTLDSARIILALDLMAFYLRSLQHFYMSKDLGPKLVMIRRMLKDVLFFMCLLAVFWTGYGVVSHAITYPNESSAKALLTGIFSTTYLQLFGDRLGDTMEGGNCSHNITLIELGLADRCPEYAWIGTILRYIYIMLTSVLLLNLLIAMFSYTFSRVQDKNEELWKFHRYTLIQEYINRPTLPPPLIVFAHFCILLGTCKAMIFCGDSPHNDANGNQNNEKTKPLNQKKHARNYLMKLEKNIYNTVDIEFDGIFKKFDFRSPVEGKLLQLEERGKTNYVALQLITDSMRANTIQSMEDFDESEDDEDYIENEIHEGVHYHSRTSPYPGTTERRFHVPKNKVDWKRSFEKYNPNNFTDDSGLDINDLGKADPDLLSLEKTEWPLIKFNDKTDKYNRESFFPGGYQLDKNGLPRNPRGRTGITGRGTLWRFGPNHRIDCIITRYKTKEDGTYVKRKVGNEDKVVLEFLAVTKKRDTLTWALPGSMKLEEQGLSEKITDDLLLDLDYDDREKNEICDKVAHCLKNLTHCNVVYQGYVDETRNTDNAWVEVETRNYHGENNFLSTKEVTPLQEKLFKIPRLQWKELNSNVRMLYTSHKDLLGKVAEYHNAYF